VIVGVTVAVYKWPKSVGSVWHSIETWQLNCTHHIYWVNGYIEYHYY